MSNKIPRKGNVSSYTTGRAKKPNTIKPIRDSINDRSTGTPGTKNYVQRSALENTGTPGTKNYVQRDFTNSSSLSNKPNVLRKRPAGSIK